MNNIRAIEALNQRELEAGVPLSASWHTDWSDTAYVYIGGLPYELSEGDIITIFSQFGEPVHVNLIRDKDTGKSKGFAFLKYEDQRSTSLAVDNLGGATILGRVIRVDHTRYKPKEGDVVDENTHANTGGGAKVDGGGESRHKRVRGDGDSGDDGYERKKAPSREILKEELELQKLIREHDDEDPMKEYLIREKKEEVKKALERVERSKKSSKHKHRNERDGKSKHKHRSNQHRSRSKEPPKRHRPRSKDRRHTIKHSEEANHLGDKGKADHGERASDKNMWRERDNCKEKGGGRGLDEQKGREQDQGSNIDKEKSGEHKDRSRTEVTRRGRHGDGK